MDPWVRRGTDYRHLKACCFLASLAFVTLYQVVEAPGPGASPIEIVEQQRKQYTGRKGRQLLSDGNCETKTNSYGGDLLIVSTLDGDISALDLSHDGKVAWNLQAEEGPLLSSSISQLEVQGPEGKFKVVPSLDGGLFKWNDEEVEPVPFSADTLLSSSFKIYDDLVMVGGKESITYGINAKTGKTRYVCSTEGCNTFLGDDSEYDMDEEDIVVIQRNQQTVRAVEQRTGSEKWNFSVGQQEISFLVGESKTCKSTDITDDDYVDVDYDEEDHRCWTEHKEDVTEDPMMKVFMSPGVVVALSRDGTHTVLWKQEFSCAIANAWIIRDGVVEEMDIFASSLPALTSAQPPGAPSLPEPMMYLDMYKNQLYVQTTKVVRDALDYNAMLEAEGDSQALALPKVKWRPYYSTPSRTPIMIAHESGEVGDEEDVGSGAMALYNQYPFDTGYYPQYLYLDQTPKNWEDVFKKSLQRKKAIGVDRNKSDDELEYLNLLTMSVWNWWKEILTISLMIAISMQLFWHFVKKTTKPERGESINSETNTVDVDEVAGVAAEEMPATIKQVERTPSSFKSRYLTDFEHQECLGKGGFGIVFQAKNKVDENNYAIKRITLPNREEAREKVLREARALARLDHSGIVRYFNSWLEEPPTGWQECNDKQLLDHGDALSDTIASNTTSATPLTFNKDSHIFRDTKQFVKRTHSNDLNSGSFIDPIPESAECENKNSIKKVPSILDNIIYPNTFDMLDSSTGFGDSNSKVDKDESGSFSIEFQAVEESTGSDSDLELNSTAVFSPKLGDYLETSTPRATASISSDSTHSEPLHIPFEQYSPLKEDILNEDTDSVQIVFEDSGCADKDEDQSLDQSLSSSPTHNSTTTNTKTDDTSKRQSAGLEMRELVQSGLQNVSEKSSLFHAPIPRVYLYIQMQLCQKETLKDWLSSNTLSRDRMKLLHIFDQIMGAVHYVHECGMIHRDLKPSNIFFSLNGTIKIGDFGLVTAIDTDVETDPESDTSSDGGVRSPMDRRHTGQVGTQLYMSPEQGILFSKSEVVVMFTSRRQHAGSDITTNLDLENIIQLSGRSYDYKVDIFSLGLIFFELLHPFSTQMERITILTTARKLTFPGRFTKELPTESKFAKWLLSATPEKRPDATEITQSELFEDMYRDFVPPRPTGARQRYSSNSSS